VAPQYSSKSSVGLSGEADADPDSDADPEYEADADPLGVGLPPGLANGVCNSAKVTFA